jgi:hypothetical protein
MVGPSQTRDGGILDVIPILKASQLKFVLATMLPSIDALRFSAPGIEGVAPLLEALLLKVGRARCDISLSRRMTRGREHIMEGGRRRMT